MGSTYPVERFAGLDVMSDPQELGATGALDLLNVTLDRPGQVRCRDGSTILSTSATANAITGLAYYKAAAGTEYLVASDGSTVYPFNLSTGVVATTQALTTQGGNNSFVRFGDTSNTLLYVGTTAAGFASKYNGSTWTAVTTPIQPDLLAVTPNDNRLVIAAVGGSKVHWSDAGVPETFGASNFVNLSPGDGETITALARWRDRLLVFKQTKLAVFTNPSIDATGSPVFNYYMVDAGQGANTGAVVAGDDGLYFANNSGVYVTTGSEPVYLSRALEPWIRAGTSASLPSISLANVTMAYLAKTLYITDRTNRTTLTFDTVGQSWSVWQLGASAIVSVSPSSTLSRIYFGENSSKKVWKMDPAASTDNGSTISWRYQSGWYDLGVPAQEKNVLQSRVTGTGTATLARFRDYGTADANSAALTLGSSTVATTVHPVSWAGTLMSHKVSGTGAATVSSLSHDVSSVMAPGFTLA